MSYQLLSDKAQARVRATLSHTQSGQLSAKLQRALEEDHLARTLLGQVVAPVAVRLDAMRRTPASPPVNPGGGGPPRG